MGLRIYCICLAGDLANFIKNSEWIVDEFPVEKHVLYYNCCPEPYPDITFTVVMQVGVYTTMVYYTINALV